MYSYFVLIHIISVNFEVLIFQCMHIVERLEKLGIFKEEYLILKVKNFIQERQRKRFSILRDHLN